MNKYTYEEVFDAATIYFNDEIAANVWINKYAMSDGVGNYYEKTPDDMFKRMAHEFAKIEKTYSKQIPQYLYDALSDMGKTYYGQGGMSKTQIYEFFKDFERVIPQGSVMSQLGNTFSIGSLSNCTVIDSPKDSYNGIILADLSLANLMKRRCGVGLDISTLRPANAKVSNAANTSTGAVSFMERFSNTTKEVSQNGRRGALMISIDINHPMVHQFATIKNDRSKVTGANISIRISDEFMEAVKSDSDFLHVWPIETNKAKYSVEELPYNVLIEKSGVYLKRIKAKSLWNVIIKSARDSAEPGLLFWDRQHNYSTSSIYPNFKNIATNPCAEIGLGKNDSCRLVSTNMFTHVENPFTVSADFNYQKWYETIYHALIINDDLVDLEIQSIDRILDKIKRDKEPEYIKEPERLLWEEFKKVGLSGRRTGVGLTGVGDTIAALGFKYDSDEALQVAARIAETKFRAELDASIDLAILRGSFEDFDPKYENKSEMVQMMQQSYPEIYNRMMKYGRRNISISTIAPNGSLSLLAGNITSGIEPLFMPFYTRRKKINPNESNVRVDYKDNDGNHWQEFNIIHPNLKKFITTQDCTIDPDKLTVEELEEWFNKSPYFQSTAHDVDWKNRVKLQSVFQVFTSHSISSTINLPENVTIKEVGDIYMMGWEYGLKGVTIYRDGSRDGVLVKDTSKNALDEFFEIDLRDRDKIVKVHAPKRPENLKCEIHNLTARGQRWTVLVGMLQNQPYEVWAFMNKGNDIKDKFGVIYKYKKGSYSLLDSEGNTKIKNLNDLMVDDEENLTRQISLSLRTGADMKYVVHALNKSKGNIVSFAKAIARTLSKYVLLDESDYEKMDKKCPECEDPQGLVYENGCISCKSCGFSKCG